MTRELQPLERQVLQQLDALRQRFLDAHSSEAALFEINNAISLWSALRGYHYALLGHNDRHDPPPTPLPTPKEEGHDDA